MTVRVLIVDDSATMRGMIAAALAADPQIEIVAACAGVAQAQAAIKTLAPDVMTLDIEMPDMNGLEFLEKIMRLQPLPVVMVSAMTQAGADASLRALELGALDCVGKPVGAAAPAFAQLPEIVKEAAAAAPRRRAFGLGGPRFNPHSPRRHPYQPDGRIIAIGSSTGGVEALVDILTEFPENCPPTVISQHLPAMFTKTFAARLNNICRPHVAEAWDGAPIAAGHIYLARGDAHLEFAGGPAPHCRLSGAAPVNRHRPSVDVMFKSAARIFGPGAIGVILTGMGRDGAAGLLDMRDAGADTIGQDEASSIVYGMPRSAHDIGAVKRQLPLSKIAGRLLHVCKAAETEPAT